MMKKTFIKNKTAVSAPLEFTIAFSILMIGLIFLYISTSTLFAVYDVPDPDYEAKAIEIADVLLSTPGYPYPDCTAAGWESYDTEHIIGCLHKLGLACSNEPYGVLSFNKIDALETTFNDLGDAGYEKVKEAIGLDYQYNFNITIAEYGKDPMLVYGKNYSNSNMVKSFSRNVLINPPPSSIKATMTVVIFR